MGYRTVLIGIPSVHLVDNMFGTEGLGTTCDSIISILLQR